MFVDGFNEHDYPDPELDVDYTYAETMEMAPVRPRHPGMLDADDLTPGLTVRPYYREGPGLRYEVVSDPVEGIFQAERLDPPVPGLITNFRLSEMGMEPYSSGGWDPTNYMTAAGDE